MLATSAYATTGLRLVQSRFHFPRMNASVRMEPTEEQKLRAQEREQGRGDRWEQRTRDGDVENAIRNDKGIVVRDEHTVYLKEEEEDDNNRSFVLELSMAAKEMLRTIQRKLQMRFQKEAFLQT